MPTAARVSDLHACPKAEPGPVPHVGGPVLGPGELTVLIGGMPAARAGDAATCVGPPDAIARGESTVLIGQLPAARLGDASAHGGTIISGCPTVLIGNTAQVEALRTAAQRGAALCEICEKRRRQRELRGGVAKR